MWAQTILWHDVKVGFDQVFMLMQFGATRQAGFHALCVCSCPDCLSTYGMPRQVGSDKMFICSCLCGLWPDETGGFSQNALAWREWRALLSVLQIGQAFVVQLPYYICFKAIWEFSGTWVCWVSKHNFHIRWTSN